MQPVRLRMDGGRRGLWSPIRTVRKMLPQAQRTELRRFLLDVTVHPGQHVIEQRDRLTEVWPFVEHDTLGAR